MKQVFSNKGIIFALVLFSIILTGCKSSAGSPVVPSVPNYPDMVFASDRDGDLEIWAWEKDTGVFSQLTFNDSIDDKHPALSVDGSKIAYISGSTGSWGLYTMNSDGSDIFGSLVTMTETYDGHPSWSPDGTIIAFDKDYDIYKINSNGVGGEIPLANTTNDEKEPAWSPDGSEIAYSNKPGPDGDYNVYKMDANGNNPLQLTTDIAIDEKPSWSDDGSKIVFSTFRNGDYDIYTIDSDDTNESTLASLAKTIGIAETSPSWSADGTEIAYVKDGDIYIRNSDGFGVETNITNTGSGNQDPSW